MKIQKTIYKYYNISTNERKEWLLKTFKDNVLYFSIANQLNDPFEFRFTTSFEASKEEKIAKIVPSIVAAEQLSIDAAQQKAQEIFSRPEKDIREWEETNLNEFKNIVCSKTAICCFSEICTNILMWSHYACSHEGICVSFDSVNEDCRNFIAKTLNVSYPENSLLPTINFYNESPEELAKKIALTKSIHWSYEKERRKLEFFSDAGYKEIPKGIITKIILGAKFKEENINFIKKLTNHYDANIEVLKAHVSKDKYELYISE